MIKYINIVMLFGVVFSPGCVDDICVEDPDFEVRTEQNTYSVGEVVNFEITGNPEIVSFYSGEIRNDYDFTEGRILESKIFVSFETQILGGTQEDQFRVVVSKNFNGGYDVENVEAASWIDVSDKFRLAAHEDNQELVFSGEVELTEYFEEDQPLYFGFHYINRPNSEFGQYNIWRFRDFQMKAVTEIEDVNLATQGSAGWQIVQKGDWEPNRIQLFTSQLTFKGNLKNDEVYQEAWGISQPVYTSTQIDLGPDRAVAIKGLSDPVLSQYEYVFNEPGNYTVTFVGANSSLCGQREVVRRIDLTITD